MKIRKLLTVMLTAALMMGLAGCGETAEPESTEAAAEESAEEAAEEAAEASESGASTADAGVDKVVDESVTYDNIEEFIELGDYDSLEITRSEDVVTDGYPEGIGELIGYRLSYDTVDYGRTVTMDYVGTIDGVPFEGGTAENADLKIGSHSFIDDFEDQLVGAKPGDVVEVNVTFPEDYNTEKLAGKDALFTCTIHSVWEDLLDGYVAMCTAKQYPKDIYDLMLKTVQDNNQSNADAYGMTLEEYKEKAHIEPDETVALGEVKWALVNKGILKALDATPESETYQAMQQVIFAASGFETMDDAIAAGLTEQQIGITTEYYTAVQMLLKEHGLI